MTWISLKMIFLGSLLFLNDQTSSSSSTTTATGSSRCIGMDKINKRTDRFQKPYDDKWRDIKKLLPLQDTLTCRQMAGVMQGEISNRSLSPWKYRIDQDKDRFPPEIVVAKCLCQGCIINGYEDHRYNSVPVFAPLMVLRKVWCSLDKYVVKRDVIRIPVACTCVVPKYTKRSKKIF